MEKLYNITKEKENSVQCFHFLTTYTTKSSKCEEETHSNIYIYTRVPPLAEADKIGLVTGEIGPTPVDDFFPLVVVAPLANTAASKN